jgi:hypothetical protein
MIIVVTSIELKSPWKFFQLANYARKTVHQLKNTQCTAYKTTGFWTKHYTMTAWENEREMQAFAHSGAHREAMKKSGKIASEIRTRRVTLDELPSWKEARQLLEKARVVQYG